MIEHIIKIITLAIKLIDLIGKLASLISKHFNKKK